MLANQDAHTFELSYSNRLIRANQNALAFGLSLSVARMKMKPRHKSSAVAMTKMMVAVRQRSIHHRPS